MKPFAYTRARSAEEGVRRLAAGQGEAAPLFGGTTLIDLAKLDVLRPREVVDLKSIAGAHRAIALQPGDRISLGALATMAEAERHPLLRARCPAAAQALTLAASPQIREMASLGGNLLQRTRCPYYRDPSWHRCNRRDPGSGCQAIEGVATNHAVLGTSDMCIASYPGDFATVLAAFGAELQIAGRGGTRVLPLDRLHRRPADAPQLETVLNPGDLIMAISLPVPPWYARSAYVKLRDRASYAFAEASAAVALDLDGDRVRAARVGLGGVASVPWRSEAAEAALVGRTIGQGADHAAEAAFADAKVRPDLRHKVEAGRRALIEAVRVAATGEAAHG